MFDTVQPSHHNEASERLANPDILQVKRVFAIYGTKKHKKSRS